MLARLEGMKISRAHVYSGGVANDLSPSAQCY